MAFSSYFGPIQISNDLQESARLKVNIETVEEDDCKIINFGVLIQSKLNLYSFSSKLYINNVLITNEEREDNGIIKIQDKNEIWGDNNTALIYYHSFKIPKKESAYQKNFSITLKDLNNFEYDLNFKTVFIIEPATMYTITYQYLDKNEKIKQNKFHNIDIKLYSNLNIDWKKEGMYLQGWKEVNSLENKIYSLGEIIQDNKNIVLEPIWNYKIYEINIFDEGRNIYSGSSDSKDGTFLIDLDLKKDNYNFIGVSLINPIDKEFSLSKNLIEKNKKIKIIEDTILYAIWEPRIVKITYYTEDNNIYKEDYCPFNNIKIIEDIPTEKAPNKFLYWTYGKKKYYPNQVYSESLLYNLELKPYFNSIYFNSVICCYILNDNQKIEEKVISIRHGLNENENITKQLKKELNNQNIDFAEKKDGFNFSGKWSLSKNGQNGEFENFPNEALIFYPIYTKEININYNHSTEYIETIPIKIIRNNEIENTKEFFNFIPKNCFKYSYNNENNIRLYFNYWKINNDENNEKFYPNISKTILLEDISKNSIDLIPQYEENLLNYYKFSITNDNNKLNLIAENVTEVTEDETIDNFPFYQYSVQAKTIKETNENLLKASINPKDYTISFPNIIETGITPKGVFLYIKKEDNVLKITAKHKNATVDFKLSD